MTTTRHNTLKTVRTRRKLEVSDVAKLASISPDRLGRFEEGTGSPSLRQIESLAEIYGVPSYSLFAETVPSLQPLPKDYRRSDPSPATLSAKGMKRLWSTQQISQFSGQLGHALNFAYVDLLADARKLNFSQSRATAMRAVFDEWFSSKEKSLKLTGAREQRFLKGFQLFVECQGSILNINDAPPTDYMGFFITPEGGLPTMFVNRSVQSKKAQLFTLIHEFAHSLAGEDGVSNPFELLNKVERLCNSFAAEFLAPVDDFRKLVDSIYTTTREETSDFVNRVSSRSLLSRHAAAIRLFECDYISRSQLIKWQKIFARSPRQEKDEDKLESPEVTQGNPHAKRVTEIGHLPIFLAKRGLDKKLIDKFDIASGIGLSVELQERAFSLAQRRFEIASST